NRHRAGDEEPTPGGVVDDQAGEDDPKPAADSEHRRDEPDCYAELFPGELVADDSEAERKDGAARALDRASHDQHPDVPSAGGGDRADEEDSEADHQQPLFAVLVAELPEEWRRDGGHEQEDLQHPGDPGR